MFSMFQTHCNIGMKATPALAGLPTFRVPDGVIPHSITPFDAHVKNVWFDQGMSPTVVSVPTTPTSYAEAVAVPHGLIGTPVVKKASNVMTPSPYSSLDSADEQRCEPCGSDKSDMDKPADEPTPPSTPLKTLSRTQRRRFLRNRHKSRTDKTTAVSPFSLVMGGSEDERRTETVQSVRKLMDDSDMDRLRFTFRRAIKEDKFSMDDPDSFPAGKELMRWIAMGHTMICRSTQQGLPCKYNSNKSTDHSTTCVFMHDPSLPLRRRRSPAENQFLYEEFVRVYKLGPQ